MDQRTRGSIERRIGLSLLVVVAQVSGARLKVLFASIGYGGLGFRLLALEVFEVRRAEPTTDVFDVKCDVVDLFFAGRLEQKAAELFSRRTANSMAPPDLADRMNPRVAPTDDCHQSLGKFGFITHGRFDYRHLARSQRFVEVRF